MDVAT